MELVERLLRGDRRAIARAITIIEGGSPQARQLIAAIFPDTGRTHIVGVTGSPGSGKSTLVNQLALEWRRRGATVGIIAVDPTSPFSGGAILGDRIRMQSLGGDSGVFIRSMASRGSLGGLARATGDVIKVFDAAGFDVVIVETVGVGQAEVEIAREAHTVIVVEVPGMGDEIQAIKAGILEIADVFVVNKADREGADRVVRQLRMMLQLGQNPRENWTPPIVKTIASQGQGIPEVIDAAEAHLRHLREHGLLAGRERQRLVRELRAILKEAALQRLRDQYGQQARESLIDRLVRREIDPYTAAEEVLRIGFSAQDGSAQPGERVEKESDTVDGDP